MSPLEQIYAFWEEGKYVQYFEHKTDSYKNNKRKIYTYNKGIIFMETPYKEDNSFGFFMGFGKLIDNETLDKFFTEISKTDFFARQIIHIPTK